MAEHLPEHDKHCGHPSTNITGKNVASHKKIHKDCWQTMMFMKQSDCYIGLASGIYHTMQNLCLLLIRSNILFMLVGS